MIDIIHFSMTASPIVNYVTDVVFTVFVYVLPIKLVFMVLERGSKWF